VELERRGGKALWGHQPERIAFWRTPGEPTIFGSFESWFTNPAQVAKSQHAAFFQPPL
jgi:hypothetical protein